MIEDQNKFIKLKEEDGYKVIFGNKVSTRIDGKGTINIDNGKNKAHNVLYVEGLEHNLLSVSQMCDQGYDLTFNSKICEIRSVDIRKLVAKANKTLGNVTLLME